MTPRLVPTLLLAALVAGAFVAGQASVRDGAAALLSAQGGRGPDPKDPKKGVTPATTTPPKSKEPLLLDGGGGNGAAANGFIAVTGSYGVGTSVLYVLDTNTKQIAVYEARGGSPGSRRLYFVGARRIDLDLQLVGYNDESDPEVQYDSLKRRFDSGRAEAAEAIAPKEKPPAETSGK